MCSCRVPSSPAQPPAPQAKRSCGSNQPLVSPRDIPRSSCNAPDSAVLPTGVGTTRTGTIRWDVSAEELLAVLNKFPGSETVRPYVVDTVNIQRAGVYEQRGSAPNFSGGLGTLATCKHQMRSRYSAGSWSSGVWVLGLTGLSRWRHGQQPFYYLMRVAQAHESQADLVRALEAQGRQDVLAAKDSRAHQLGDIFMPKRPLAGAERFKPENYIPPRANHVHSQPDDPLGWHNDIFYDGTSHTRPPLLVGNPEYTFVWTRPVVGRRSPLPIRDYQNWTLARLRSVILGVEG
jgi:hypothetical protein